METSENTEQPLCALRRNPVEAELVDEPADMDVSALCYEMNQSEEIRPLPITHTAARTEAGCCCGCAMQWSIPAGTVRWKRTGSVICACRMAPSTARHACILSQKTRWS